MIERGEVHDRLAREAGLCAERHGRGVEREMAGMVGVGGEQETAPRVTGQADEGGVEVLSPRKSVDLDEDASLG